MATDPYTYFRVEAREILEGLSQGVLSLEKSGLGKDVISRMLRQAHTLKGAARVVKQIAISESAHGIEDVLAPYRDREGQLPHEDAGRLLALIDRCDELLKSLTLQAAVPTSSRASSEREEPIESVRVEIAQLDATLRDVAEAQIHLEALDRQVPLLDRSRRTAKRLAQRTRGLQRRRPWLL